MPPSEAEALFELVSSRYSDRLTPDQLAEVKTQVERLAEMAQAVRAVKLDPRDEPMALFRPYTPEEA